MSGQPRWVFRSHVPGIVTTIAALTVAAVLGVIGSAWACVPQPRLVVLSPMASGVAGARITVEGVGFDPPPITLDVRWNSPTGPQLGVASGPSFSLGVTIPSAEPGLYSIIVLSREPGGNIGNTGRASFQVTTGAAGGSAAPESSTASTVEAERDRVSPGPLFFGLAVGAGFGLLLLGAVAGSFLARRRLQVEASADNE